MNSMFAQVNSQSAVEKLPLRSLVFIDSGVADYESIVAGVLPGQQVIILDRQKNGIEQITSEIEKYASTNGAIDSVHIISHGNSGNLELGNTSLSSDNIEQYKSQLEKWHNGLSKKADIMLYGCDVASGTGANFVDRISELTGADVAASTNLTGIGGDWNLEFAKDITIDGAAATGLTISGNNASRAFFVNANVATSTNFAVKNLIITNGKTTDRGGAIGTTDEVNLTVDNVQFNNNVADKGGGAIFGNFNNTLTVTNSKFLTKVAVQFLAISTIL